MLDVKVDVVVNVQDDVIILENAQLQLTAWMNKLIVDEILNLRTDDLMFGLLTSMK